MSDLAVYLRDPGAVPGIGIERGKATATGIAKYVSPFGSVRYVAYVSGQAIAALQVVTRDKRHAIIANAYTAPAFR